MLTLTSAPRIYHCEPDWKWSPPSLPDYDAWIILRGRGELSCGGKAYRLRPGSAFLFGPGARISAGHDPAHPLRVFAAHFLPVSPEIKRELRFGPACHAQVELSDLTLATLLAERCSAHALGLPPGGRLYGKSLLETLVLQVLEARRQEQRPAVESRIQRLLEEIRQLPAADWNAALLARRTGLSVPQFNRRFRALAGTSLRQFVISRKIERALQLLRETDLSIAQIAEALGYTDVFFFHRQFRKEAAATPHSFRKKRQGGK
jgi:AraC-like DNA-binding protein